jgi:uncharacterized cupredoxin-like copper-binding protein
VLLAALSTGHKIGLALAVAGFAGFSLVVSMLVPRWRPQFPGRGLRVFLAAVALMFVGMLFAVQVFGKESEEGEAGAEGAPTAETTATTATTATTTASTETTTTGTTQKSAPTTIKATETEFKIQLPKTSVPAGSYTFDVSNDGKVPHDLVVKGNGVDEATPTLQPGQSKTLTVDLKSGTYDVYCSIPGHKEAGMDLKLTVS